jgi:hypothetical protein
MPATACFDEPTEIIYNGTQGSATPTWNFDGGTAVSGSGFGPYQIKWNSEGVKTISLTVNGTTKTATIKVLPEISTTFTLPGNIFYQTEMEIGLPAVPQGSTFSWSLSNNATNFLEHNLSARVGNAKGTLKIIGGGERYRELTLTVTTPNGCSKSYTKEFDVTPAIEPPAISLVYPDENNHNVIAWDFDDLPAGTVEVIIYKEGAALNDFRTIGSASPTDGEFTDTSSNSTVHSDRYAISALASSGVESPKSATHQTLHLTINRGVSDGAWNLIWNNYQGREISSYRILHGATPENLSLLEEISSASTSYTHTDNPSAPYYAVEYVPAAMQNAPGRNVMRYVSTIMTAGNLTSGRSNIVNSAAAATVNYVTAMTVQTLAGNPVLSEQQENIYLYTEIFPASATYQNVSWSIISGSEFAVIDNSGKLQATRHAQAGAVTVKATAADGSGISATRQFNVSAFAFATISVTGISLDIADQSLQPGDQLLLTATVLPENATNKNVSWTSDNSAVASVTQNGLVTANATGTAIITVITQDGNKTATCVVTVKTASGINEILENAISLYPNPVESELLIRMEEPIGHVEIIDISGRIMMRENNSAGKINVSHLRPGIYLVKIRVDSRFVIKQFIKK